MKIFNEPIPEGKLTQFDEILKTCGGRYLSNPRKAVDRWGAWRVDYSYDSVTAANRHQRLWRRVTTDIVEVRRRRPWWKRMLRIGKP